MTSFGDRNDICQMMCPRVFRNDIDRMIGNLELEFYYLGMQ